MVDHLIHHVRLNALALRTNAEEILNSITHGAGLALAVGAGTSLVAQAASNGDAWRTAGCLIFAVTLIGVYAASTLSHLAQRRPWRHVFRTWDQALIYLLIAGTFTPFAFAYLRDGWWWLLTGAMWAIAFYGFFTKVALQHRIDGISIWLYLALGWLPAVGVGEYLRLMPVDCVLWIVGGGLCYTAGAVFLVFDYKRAYFHAIWHLLVIAGSACHYLGIWLFVAS